MIKKLILIIVFFSICFSVQNNCLTSVFFIIKSIPIYSCSQEFMRYADSLGLKESGNNPDIINEIRCFAEHQWKEQTLKWLGFNIKLKNFRDNPRQIFPRTLQIEALKALIDTNKVLLEPYKFYVGTIIDSVLITESGLLATCHLGGPKSVKKYLLSRGNYLIIDGMRLEIKHSKKHSVFNSRDIFGTTIKDYLKEFQGFSI
jgi:hypothetical protein